MTCVGLFKAVAWTTAALYVVLAVGEWFLGSHEMARGDITVAVWAFLAGCDR